MNIKMNLENVKIAVIGQGYVGLPLAIEFGKKYPTFGFDIKQARIDELKKMEPLIVFCRSGNRSEHVMHYLRNQGIEEVWNGGGWIELNAELNY